MVTNGKVCWNFQLCRHKACRAAYSVNQFDDLAKSEDALRKRIDDMGEHFDRDVQDVLSGIFSETIHERDTLKLENEALRKKLANARMAALGLVEHLKGS